MPGDDTARSRLFGILLIAAVIAVPVVTGISVFYTDVLWFRELGQEGVFWTVLLSRAVTGAAFAAVMFALVYGNIYVARRMAPRAWLRSVTEVPLPFEQALGDLRMRIEPVARWVIFGIAATIASTSGIGMSVRWHEFQLALKATSFGVADPQFGRDIGFYVFSLPALRAVSDWVFGALAITLVVTVAVYFFDGAIRPWMRSQAFAPHVKVHLSVLLGVIVASRALEYWLRIFELNYSPRGQVVGASYTDVNAQIPALTVLIVIALVSAVIMLVNIRFQGWRLPIIALGVWVAASVLVGSFYPAIVQQLRVAPNEVAAEAPYIERNIAATREAFGIEDVQTKPFPAEEDLTADDVIRNNDTLDNVRLWDPNVVAESYRQLQGIRPYYQFRDVDIDRYKIGDERRQVLISAREMDVTQLAEQARTWVNEHLVYTHGYGLVMSPVSESTGKGMPQFVLRDLPPEGTAGLEMKQPGIYYGEGTSTYAIVNTGIEEFDYPIGDRNATTTYKGAAGIEVGGIARRLAFAIRFGSTQLLFSQYITPSSKVLFRRQISERVTAVAPWLRLDSDPYPVLSEGRIVWILDGYTTSDMYPYSQPTAGVTYIRNSVKVTIDAYDGTTTLYAFDPEDPVLATWRKVFPDLVVDAADMPNGIREHLRYPEDLFRVQAEAYKNYHMLDPQVFYNKEDSWALPGEAKGGETMAPFYVLMQLPGETTEDFLLMLPFTPRNRDNMIGWMAAKSDPKDYGRRVVYEFPKKKVILGPEQISARINQDPVISPQLSLWNQRGSQALFGNLLVIPLEDSIVYIQPLYLQAERTAMPELTRVLVAYADRIAMERDLKSALLTVFGEGTPTPSAEPTGAPPSPEADVQRALELYERALTAQRAGDWAAYGKHLGDLGDVLERLAKASGTPTGTP